MPQVLTPVIDPAIRFQAELVLWASGSQYRGGQSLVTTVQDALGVTPFILTLLNDPDAATARTTLGLGSAATKELTSLVAYTPTFTGFGTVTGVSVWSRRVGDCLHMRGKFVTGTSTAVEARMTLGFNGTNSNVTSDATKVASIQLAGPMVCSSPLAGGFHMLIESNIGYVTFGFTDGATAGTTKQLGNAIAGTSRTFTFVAEIPITGW